jgi:hypothetical protein
VTEEMSVGTDKGNDNIRFTSYGLRNVRNPGRVTKESHVLSVTILSSSNFCKCTVFFLNFKISVEDLKLLSERKSFKGDVKIN